MELIRIWIKTPNILPGLTPLTFLTYVRKKQHQNQFFCWAEHDVPVAFLIIDSRGPEVYVEAFAGLPKYARLAKAQVFKDYETLSYHKRGKFYKIKLIYGTN